MLQHAPQAPLKKLVRCRAAEMEPSSEIYNHLPTNCASIKNGTLWIATAIFYAS